MTIAKEAPARPVQSPPGRTVVYFQAVTDTRSKGLDVNLYSRPRRWLAALATSVASVLWLFPASVEASSDCSLPTGQLDPEQLMQRCAACANAGRMLDAGKLWYATSVRWRTLAAIDPQPDRAPAIMGSLQEMLGRPVNEWLGGDLRDWLVALDWAIDWDRRVGFPDLIETGRFMDEKASPRTFQQAYEKQRSGLRDLRDTLAKQDPGGMYRTRLDNGLDVRDPRFDAATRRMR